MSKELKIDDKLYMVSIGKNYAYMYTDDSNIIFQRDFQEAIVRPIYISAISRVEANKDSSKFFFTVNTKYYYSNEIGGVASEQSCFELGDFEGGIGGTSSSILFNTEAGAISKKDEWDKSQAVFYEERKAELINRLETVIAEIKETGKS